MVGNRGLGSERPGLFIDRASNAHRRRMRRVIRGGKSRKSGKTYPVSIM
jgi:hypothetical protein